MKKVFLILAAVVSLGLAACSAPNASPTIPLPTLGPTLGPTLAPIETPVESPSLMPSSSAGESASPSPS